MMTSILFILILLISLTFNGLAIVAVRRALTKVDSAEEAIESYDTYFNHVQNRLQFILSSIKSIDERGIFESDDEVGSTFDAIRQLLATLDNFIAEPNDIKTDTDKT